jgi:ankyrin repeat protein
LLAVFSQAQESDPPKLLLDSIRYDNLDVSGVRAALDKAADPNWISDTKRRDSVNSVIGHLAFAALGAKGERAEERSVEILQILFRAGAKLQPCDQGVLFYPVANGWALFTEVLLKNGANPTREIEGWTPMEIAVNYGQTKIVELLKRYRVPPLERGIAASLYLLKRLRTTTFPKWRRQSGTGLM